MAIYADANFFSLTMTTSLQIQFIMASLQSNFHVETHWVSTNNQTYPRATNDGIQGHWPLVGAWGG